MRGSAGVAGAGIFIIIGPAAPASCPRPALAPAPAQTFARFCFQRIACYIQWLCSKNKKQDFSPFIYSQSCKSGMDRQ